MKHLILVVFLTFAFVSCAQNEAANVAIQQLVETYAADKLLNGTIIVAHKDSIIYKGQFGYANIETKEKIKSSTLFPIASLTKQFTATAIMMLQEKSKLSIENEISDYIDVPTCMQSVTIKNLLNHTSGIPNYWQNKIANNKDSIFDFLYHCDSLLFSPNTDFAYSNSGYFLLGEIIEAVSQKTYDEFLHDNIFIPIGMNNTFVYDGLEYTGARGYSETWEINEYLATTADGGIISTIDDLLLWDRAISHKILLPADIQNKMFEPTELKNERVTKYGFGWVIELTNVSIFAHLSRKYKDLVSHTGGLSSFGAYNQYDTKKDVYVIVLSNQVRPELMNLISEINGVLY